MVFSEFSGEMVIFISIVRLCYGAYSLRVRSHFCLTLKSLILIQWQQLIRFEIRLC